MLRKLFGMGKSTPQQPTRNIGFHINDFNKNTFLYNSLKNNNIHGVIDYFHALNEKKDYKKWLCPLFCDITLFDNYERTVKPLHKIIEKNHGHYFFDMSIEAIPYYPLDSYLSKKFQSFHHMLEHHAIDPHKVYFVSANLAGDTHYDSWRNKMGVKYRIANNIMTHQYSLGGFSEPFKQYFNKDNLFQNNLALCEKSVTQHAKRNYYFTCLMLRPRSHRTAIMLHLMERGHVDKGMVSYFGNEFGSKDAQTVETDELTYENISHLPSGKRLISQWDKLLKASPITIDSTLKSIKEHGWASFFFPREFIEDTASLNKRSYFEIVTETHFTDDSCLYLTEKSIWPIVSLQPFITVGSPFTLKYLQDLGFQTFSPVIDETYDSIADPNLRMELIMKEIDRLCSMSLTEIHDLYCSLWPRLLHNYHHYFNKSKELAAEQIQQRILSFIN